MSMEQERNPAIIAKELIEKVVPAEFRVDNWDEVWQDVIEQLDQQIPFNDN